MQNPNFLGSEGLASLSRFSEEISAMLTPKQTSVVISHNDGVKNLVEGITFAVFDDINKAELGIELSGKVCTFNINVPFNQEAEDTYDVDHVDSAISFMDAMCEHYDVFVINSLSTLISSNESQALLAKVSYKGVLSNMVKIHQLLIKIKKPCVITNHFMNGEIYLGNLIKKYARDVVFL